MRIRSILCPVPYGRRLRGRVELRDPMERVRNIGCVSSCSSSWVGWWPKFYAVGMLTSVSIYKVKGDGQFLFALLFPVRYEGLVTCSPLLAQVVSGRQYPSGTDSVQHS